MIKIERTSKPEALTEDVQIQLTDIFKKDKTKTVWNKKYIKDGLLKMSSNKCCYCEELIGDGCSEMHVEHYHDKDTYPDEVVVWENLLPSCAHCNKKKSKHDTYKEPIVDPTKNDPKKFLYMKSYRYFSYDKNPDSLGKVSIAVLGINDTEEKVKLRFVIGNKLNEEIDKLYEDAIELGDEILTNIRKQNRITNGCMNNLRLCTRTARFGASMATILQENDEYHELRKLLQKYNIWSEEMEQLHKEASEICLCWNETNCNNNLVV